MMDFDTVRRRVAEHRICLERDVAAGIIPSAAVETIDDCYAYLDGLVESARVELEAAGPSGHDHEFVQLFVGGCARLGRRMFAAMYQRNDSRELQRVAGRVRADGQVLMEHLRERLRRAA